MSLLNRPNAFLLEIVHLSTSLAMAHSIARVNCEKADIARNQLKTIAPGHMPIELVVAGSCSFDTKLALINLTGRNSTLDATGLNWTQLEISVIVEATGRNWTQLDSTGCNSTQLDATYNSTST